MATKESRQGSIDLLEDSEFDDESSVGQYKTQIVRTAFLPVTHDGTELVALTIQDGCMQETSEAFFWVRMKRQLTTTQRKCMKQTGVKSDVKRYIRHMKMSLILEYQKDHMAVHLLHPAKDPPN
eukprot:jgi/Psemu1/15163/gm1.15163_g